MVGSTRDGRAATLRDRTRQAMRAEVVEVALRLFDQHGFDGATVDQIAAEAGLSRATFFRYFGTKEDVVLTTYDEFGDQMAGALAARPADERPWQSLRRTFDVITELNADAPEKPLRFVRMLDETPSLRARYREKQEKWQELLVPELANRLGGDDAELRAAALVASALACLSVATAAWVACAAATPLATLLDRAMDALVEP